MLFNTFSFLLFFPIVTLVYYFLSQRFRWCWLLAASCYFYMFFVPVYIFILAGTIIIDYLVGIYLENVKPENKKTLLILSIIANVGILAVFKYYNFFADNVNVLSQYLDLQSNLPFLHILLPVGLSFHTFQAMSYTIEVYRGNQKAETHFGRYALYVMFYPQLVAGPIERPQNLLHQFREKKPFIPRQVSDGLCLMLWGMFKKVVVADRLAKYVDSVYDNHSMHHGSSLALASVFFAFQIYCDFSGYSDIALGAAKTLGIDLMTNFKRPYFSNSITQFWRRWHISLSTWFRDYLYIPLGGNRVSPPRWLFNIFIVFIISGFWHGANWTFVIWGALHGLFSTINILFSKFTSKASAPFLNIIRSIDRPIFTIPFTFLLVTLAWVFFRAESVSQAVDIIKKICTDFHGKLFVKPGGYFVYCMAGLTILFFKELKDERRWNIHFLSSKHFSVRLFSIVFLLVMILLTGVLDSSQFIYFQF